MNRLYWIVGVALWAYLGAAALLRRRLIWAPLFLLGALQVAALAFLLWFHHPALVSVAAPVVQLLGGEGAVHYPGFFYALPSTFHWLRLGLVLLIGSVIFAVTVRRFEAAFRGQPFQAGEDWRVAVRRAPTLMLLVLLMVELERAVHASVHLLASVAMAIYGALYVSMRLPDLSGWQDDTKIQLLLQLIEVGALVVVEAVVVYAVGLVALQGHWLWPAIRDSARITSQILWPTLLVVAIPIGVLLPFWVLLRHWEVFLQGTSPELVAQLLAARIFVEFVLSFAVIGAMTRLLLWRLEEAR